MLRLHLQYIVTAFEALRGVFGRFFIADLLFKTLAFVLLTPLTSWLLQTVVNSSDSAAVSNTDILYFILSPTGVIGLTAVLVISIGITYAGQAVLQIIAFGQIEGKNISYFQAIQYTGRYAKELIGLGAVFVTIILLSIAPVAAIGGLLYKQNLTEHDINYYLETFPPEFMRVIFVVAPLVIALLALFIYLGISWLFALPSTLFGSASYRSAFGTSHKLAQNKRWPVAHLMGLWLLISAIVSVLATAVVQQSGNLLLTLAADNFALLALNMGLVLVALFAVGYLITFATSAITALLVVRRYKELAEETGQTVRLDIDPINEDLWQPTKRLLWIIVPITLLIAGVVGGWLVNGIRQPITVTATAHRGSSGIAPPNTLASVRQAIADGADYAEIDVQETADGVLVINHDSDYLLRAGIAKNVADVPYAEVQKMEVGSRFAAEFSGEGIPTLAEVLDEARDKIQVNIELKYYGRDEMLAQRVVEIVSEKGMQDQVLIMSLHYEGTQEVKQLAPEIKVGYLASAITVGELTDLNVDFLAVASGIATRSLIHSAHRKGMPIFVWTLNEKDEMSKFMSRGVDSIITDYPARVRDVRAERAEMSDAERLLLDFSYLLSR